MAEDIIHEATPANLSALLEQIENYINRADYGEALGLLAKAKPLADQSHMAEGACAVLLDGDSQALPLIKDLRRAGFSLQNDEHGVLWLRRIDTQRKPPITNTLVPADFQKAVLDFLRDVRLDVDQARCVSVCAEGALRHENTAETEDMAEALSGVNNTLWEQVQKLQAMIEDVEAQEVYGG